MSAMTVLLFAVLGQAAGTEAPKQQPLSIETDGYLRASDLGIEKWTVSATIGGETVLSIIRVIRRGGAKGSVMAFETVDYSREQEAHHEDILIIDSQFWDRGDTREIRVKSPGGTENSYQAALDDSVLVTTGGNLKHTPIDHVGTFVLSDQKGEKLRMMFFARLAKLSDYPKLQKLLEGSEITATSFNQRLPALPKEIKELLK
jgi:hypothetical protein